MPAIAECVYGCQNAFLREHRLGPRLLAVRDVRYKLIINFHEKTEHMFDLANDPLEHKPLDESAYKEERAHLLRAALEHISFPQTDQQLRLRARLRDLQQLVMRINQQKGEFAVATAS
jgi:hypothetical protein